MGLDRHINCTHFEPISDDEERHCGSCTQFRSNCREDGCPKCEDVPYEFYCALDKQEI